MYAVGYLLFVSFPSIHASQSRKQCSKRTLVMPVLSLFSLLLLLLLLLDRRYTESHAVYKMNGYGCLLQFLLADVEFGV